MDHVISYISEYMDVDGKEQLIAEYKSGEFGGLSDCPSYRRVKAYCEALNVLTRYYYGEQEAQAHIITPRYIVTNSI